MTSASTRRYVLYGAGALLIGALSLLVALLPVPYEMVGNYGYLGVFVVTLVATGAFVAPIPYIAAILIAGSFLNPLLVALVAGLGAAIGEMTGYAAGLAGRELLPETRWRYRLEGAMKRSGPAVIFVAALIPNPLFDAVGIMAGAARTPVWAFMVACFLGKTLRFWLLAAVGGPLIG